MTDVLTDQPFERTTVSPGAVGGAEASWVVKPDLPWPLPWSFRVDMAYTPASAWTEITTETGTDYAYIDASQYKFDFMTEVWYRIVLIDGDAAEHAGDPAQIGTYLDRRDWIIAKDVCRRAMQRMRIRTGRQGHLYKRRGWGAICEVCADEITGQATNSQCPTCYGTGITDGYHSPISMWVEMHQEDLDRMTDDKGSLRYKLAHPTMAVNFPKIAPYDVWRDLRSGKMWAVQPSVQTISSTRGLSLIVSMQLQPIEVGDVVYQLDDPS